MRQVSLATRDELLAALTLRFGQAGREDKVRILTEFVALTGYHRKHAARLLRGGSSKDRSAPRHRRRLYDDAVREALILLWEASDRICGKRLKPLIPMLAAAMERHGHLALDPAVRERWRSSAPRRSRPAPRLASRSAPSSAAGLHPAPRRARSSRSASGSTSPTRRTTSARMAARPGSGRARLRSIRPGRRSAGSMASRWLVAAKTSTPSRPMTPSNCSRRPAMTWAR